MYIHTHEHAQTPIDLRCGQLFDANGRKFSRARLFDHNYSICEKAYNLLTWRARIATNELIGETLLLWGMG